MDSRLSLKRMKSGTVLNVKSDSSNFFKLVVSHIVASPHYLLASKFCMGAPREFYMGGGGGAKFCLGMLDSLLHRGSQHP